MVTAGTYQKVALFHSAERLNYLATALGDLAAQYGWRLHAWAIFANHYHFVGDSQEPATLKRLVQYFHSVSAKFVNRLDGTVGRTVWFQYWDTQLTYPKAIAARLNYVHSSAVKHGLVAHAEDYPWCSAGWFQQNAPRSLYRTIVSFPCDRLSIPDSYSLSCRGARAPSVSAFGRWSAGARLSLCACRAG
jgi:putative transposase